MEESVERKRLPYRELFDLAPDGQIVADAHATIRVANRSAAELLGVPASSLVGESLAAFVDEPSRARLEGLLDALTQGGSTQPDVRLVIRPRGRAPFPASVAIGVSRRDGQGDSTLHLSVRDLTPRAEGRVRGGASGDGAERAPDESPSVERLEEVAAVAAVAHQIRNPLASIAAGAQILLARLELEEPDRQLIERMLERVANLSGTVEQLLEYASQREPRLDPVALLPLLRDTAAVLQDHDDVQGRRIDVRGDDLVIQADGPQLKEVFASLVINAAQAVGDGETIDVVARDEGGTACVEVRDRGPGIPEELQERVFQPFFSTKHRGIGLGLAIARRVVEAHGGTVSAVRPPEGGTTIVVRLPGAVARGDASR